MRAESCFRFRDTERIQSLQDLTDPLCRKLRVNGYIEIAAEYNAEKGQYAANIPVNENGRRPSALIERKKRASDGAEAWRASW